MSTIYNFLTQFVPASIAVIFLIVIAVLVVFLVFRIVKIVLDSLPFL